MKKLKTALRITLKTLFVLYTVWHICFTYTVIYLARDLYNLSPLDQSLMESSILVFSLFVIFMPGFSVIISLVCFGLRKRAFGITYLAVALACMGISLIQALPKPPMWIVYLAFSIFLFDSLTHLVLFVSIALAVVVSLIILYVVVSHIVDRHEAQQDTYYSKRFDNYRANIEYFTDYLRLNFGTEPSKGLYVEFIGEEPSVSDKNGSVLLDERAKESLCAVRDFFTEGFCYIDSTSGETAFYGIGSEKLVYREDKTPPSCFFDGESKRNFFTFDLGDGWYYLLLDVR